MGAPLPVTKQPKIPLLTILRFFKVARFNNGTPYFSLCKLDLKGSCVFTTVCLARIEFRNNLIKY